MTTIDRMHVRWSGADEDRRAALLSALLAEALPLAMDVLGVGQHSEVCLRQIRVPGVTADAREPDEEIATRWAGRVADAIADGVRTGDAVVFRSRHHALADMAVQVARGRLERAWAWRAAGVWPEGVADSVIADSAIADPFDVIGSDQQPSREAEPKAVDDAGLDLVAWSRLRTVSPAERDPAEVSARTLELDPKGRDKEEESAPAEPGPASRDQDHAVLGVSRTEAAHPGVSHHPSVDTGAELVAPTGGQDRGEVALPEWHAWDVEAAADALTLALAGTPEAVRAVLMHVARLGLWPALASRLGPERMAVLPDPPHMESSARPPRQEELLPEARTEWGGLLLLLNLIDGEDPIIEHMHALGTALVTEVLTEDERLHARDPALLTFAGLAPDDEAPEPPRPEHSPDPRPVIEHLAALGLDLEHVVRRAAVIAVDPGWIEVRFSIDDVDVDIRRVGLDLDPGWLPWLGVVVRFTYV